MTTPFLVAHVINAIPGREEVVFDIAYLHDDEWFTVHGDQVWPYWQVELLQGLYLHDEEGINEFHPMYAPPIPPDWLSHLTSLANATHKPAPSLRAVLGLDKPKPQYVRRPT